MTAHMLTTWLPKYFKPTVETYHSGGKKRFPFKISLFIDKVPGHPRTLIEMYNKFNIVFMTDNTTSILGSWTKLEFQVLLLEKYISQGYSCHR